MFCGVESPMDMLALLTKQLGNLASGNRSLANPDVVFIICKATSASESTAADQTLIPPAAEAGISNAKSFAASFIGTDAASAGYSSEQLFQASQLVYKFKYGGDSRSAEQLAQAARQLSEESPEAWLLLATHCSNDWEQVLQRLGKAQRCCKIAVPDFSMLKAQGDIFTRNQAMRTYFHIIHAQASALRKARQWQEALNKYHHLERLHASWCSLDIFPHFRYFIPGLLLELGRIDEADSYMRKHPHKAELYTSSPSSLSFLFTQTLCDFMLHYAHMEEPLPPYLWTYSTEDMTEDPLWFLDGRRTLMLASQSNLQLLDYFSSPTVCPGPPPHCSIKGSVEAADLYFASFGHLWRKTPHAVEWLRGHADTLQVLMHLTAKLPADQVSGFADPSRFTKALKSGFCRLDGPVQISGMHASNVNYITHQVMLSPNRNGENPLRWQKLLDAGCSVSACNWQGMTLLQMGCYYDIAPEVLTLLLKHGALAKERDVTCVLMAANQGNHRSLLVLLEFMHKTYSRFLDAPPEQQKRSLLDRLFLSMADSAAVLCPGVHAKGRKPYTRTSAPCQRCRERDAPHSLHVSFRKCVRVLVDHGLTVPAFATGRPVGNEDPNDALWALRARQCNKREAKRAAEHPAEAKRAAEHTDATPHYACLACGKSQANTEPAKKALLRCQSCRKARFCNRECQRAAWRFHSVDCKHWARRRTAGG